MKTPKFYISKESSIKNYYLEKYFGQFLNVQSILTDRSNFAFEFDKFYFLYLGLKSSNLI